MSEALQKILATGGSVREIRELGLSNGDLVAAAGEIAALQGYHGQIECEHDAVTGELLPARERVTKLRALTDAVILAQQ